MKLDPTRPIIYLITSGECRSENFNACLGSLVDTVTHAVDAGIDLVQIREKSLTGKLLFELTCRLSEALRESATRLLVNDRFDVALAAGADGVHLTSTSMLPGVVRTSTPDGFLIGVSVHRGDDMGATEDADFALFGPVFATPGKGDGVGLAELTNTCRTIPIPTIAVGGIAGENCRDVLNAGAAGIAAIRALNDVQSMHAILKEVRR